MFIRDVLIRSVLVFVGIYLWFFVKSLFTGEVSGGILDVVISGAVFWGISEFVIRGLDK